ncbi:MAG: hypothetical protein A2268_02210 [Candidatus Raymondbacteria bacterium RifOxyA12_full_50_37]|uniref:Uncharacterized protein n=1 Tax=Candidatus Raymondbacteria bacterium RIFOXYD12_FULL_49_13 TaxID=1817890 RepID=A0A1F7F5R0_UNCRA|nr:MAG: hypothetical protein A2268_02210 [Candidatus Raymondbacteria bacterium RifOxyA12_full_50_37]OGJ92240.1 MAG: hypothetical protein A2248_11040 [Candidatus Raymondbacteria bacterium RIFOXYA2_FULL_49_16]OGJ97856.1 MAG: hypothetical protein A2487_21545 [Candidatus Raymondbacteria bacterium RifOxyC12_full_50_8]OGJ98566.1 MAG: hypothetical protein A2453_06840 [Candidatus Raymondbacteria bacterium RIFOXYC2_FULL_50_21]OGK01867.1 MAG: hypothetical protein A2519_04735 [Candidatus Raymondbacteria b
MKTACIAILSLALSISAFSREKFSFMQEFHGSWDGLIFFMHKDTAYKARYFIETNVSARIAMAGYDNRAFFFLEYKVKTGLGRQSDIVIFDPRDIAFASNPVFEYRFKKVRAQAGLDHSCLHDIDRDDHKTEYWNEFFLSACSPNYLLEEFRPYILSHPLATPFERTSWYAMYGYFSKDFFGLANPSAISGGHTLQHEFSAGAGYSPGKTGPVIVNARLGIRVLVDEAGHAYQTCTPELECHMAPGTYGFMFFLKYNALDQSPVRPRDGLLELGIRGYL